MSTNRCVAWGDVATAYYSTSIPNIETYLAATRATRVGARLMRLLKWLFAMRTVREFLRRRIQSGPPGPSDEERARGWTRLWGEVSDDAGNRAVSLLRGPEGYTWTVLTALASVQRVLAGQAPPGFQTPALAFGADFVLELPGVERSDE